MDNKNKNNERGAFAEYAAQNNLLTAGDAGFTFTAATLSSLVVALIFSAVIYALAAAKGISPAEYSSSLEQKFVYYLFSYGLSSVSILIAITAFSVYKKTKPFSPLPFKKFRAKYAAVGIIMAVGLIFGFSELNNLFVSLLGKIGYNKPDMTLPNEKWWQLIIWLVLAAAAPAFFEEVLFRGYILEGLKGLSAPFVILTGGLLFSLFHQNPQQTPYQFICGAAFFLVAYKSGSLWPSVIMHFANNAIVLFADFFFKEGFSSAATIALTAIGILCFAGSAVYLLFFDKNSDGERSVPAKNSPNHTKTRFFIYAAVGIAACLLMWFTDLITYMGA